MRTQEYRAIREANDILRELDAVYPGDSLRQKFRLIWSQELQTLIPEYEIKNDEAVPVMEYRCNCGINQAVHTPECTGITVAKHKLRHTSTFGLDGEFTSYPNKVWALCWFNPPPERDEWIDIFGSDEDYPAQGRYLPVSKGRHCVVIPPHTTYPDYPDCARLMVRMMKEHVATWKEEYRKNQERKLGLRMPIEDSRGNVIQDAHKDSPYHTMKAKFAEKMRHFNPTGTVGYSKESSEGLKET